MPIYPQHAAESIRNTAAAHLTYTEITPFYNIHEITAQQIYTCGAGEGGGFLKHAATAKASTSQVFQC